MLDQLVGDLAGQVRRNRKTDSDEASRLREDRCVQPDHLALNIEKRSAGVPWVNRSIGLNEVFDVEDAHARATLRTHDSGRDRM